MTAPLVNGALDGMVAERWQQLVATAGMPSSARPVHSYERPGTASAGQPPQAFIREMFVPAEPATRRSLDLFCAGLIEHRTPGGSRSELVLLGPETIRAHTALSAPGLSITDLGMGPAVSEVRAVSIMLMRITRTTRARDIVGSIEDLGRLLDYRRDPGGSTAVAHAIVRRLEVLAAMPGAEIPIMGTITRLGETPGSDAYHLLVSGAAPLSFDDDLTVRDGHLMRVGPDRRAAAWRGGDFILVQFGQPPARRGESRSVTQLRQEHALAEAGLGHGKAPAAESYGSRIAVARQSSRAERIVRQTLADDLAGAMTTFRTAVTEPGADGPLVSSIAGLVTTIGDYWLVRGLLTQAAGEISTAGVPGGVVRAALQRLDDRLDQFLELSPGSSELTIPVVTPLAFEVSDALVPFVDSRQDGGLFLDELIPAMRDRITADLGVSVPGVRARGNPDLPPGGFKIQIDEVGVVTGNALLEGSYAVRPLADDRPGPDVELTTFHPLTGEAGLWQIEKARASVEAPERLTSAQYLIHQIDVVFRSHLSRFFGLQEVSSLVESWTVADRSLVSSVLPDERAVVQVTWILQALIDEGVPVSRWKTILEVIRGAGGIERPVRTLARATRARLRDQLPGPRSGRRAVPLPAELRQALAGSRDQSRRPPYQVRHEVQQWLRRTVADLGPVLSVVAPDDDTREEVAALARRRHGLVTTFTEVELAGP